MAFTPIIISCEPAAVESANQHIAIGRQVYVLAAAQQTRSRSGPERERSRSGAGHAVGCAGDLLRGRRTVRNGRGMAINAHRLQLADARTVHTEEGIAGVGHQSAGKFQRHYPIGTGKRCCRGWHWNCHQHVESVVGGLSARPDQGLHAQPRIHFVAGAYGAIDADVASGIHGVLAGSTVAGGSGGSDYFLTVEAVASGAIES